jgi:hypothetical protein
MKNIRWDTECRNTIFSSYRKNLDGYPTDYEFISSVPKLYEPYEPSEIEGHRDFLELNHCGIITSFDLEVNGEVISTEGDFF